MGMRAILTHHRRRREIIARFRQFAACSLELARPLSELELRESMHLRRLMRRQVVLQDEKRYYLDEQALMQQRMNTVKWGMILLFLLLGMVILYMNK